MPLFLVGLIFGSILKSMKCEGIFDISRHLTILDVLSKHAIGL